MNSIRYQLIQLISKVHSMYLGLKIFGVQSSMTYITLHYTASMWSFPYGPYILLMPIHLIYMYKNVPQARLYY